MKFEITTTKDVTRQTVEVRADIVDAEPRPVPYRRDGRQWQPRTAFASWSRHRNGDGEWSPWTLGLSATVSGVQLKKDGSDSLNSTSARHLRETDPEWGEWIRSTRPADGAVEGSA